MKYGDPEKLSIPADTQGRMCGIDEEVKGKPDLFFFDLTKCAQTDVIINGCATPQVQSKLQFVVSVHLCQRLS
jgi:choline transporter-like protein 2/4/5